MGVTVGALITKVQEEIDPRKRRFGDARVLAYLNEAVSILGDEKVFKRRDILIAVSGQSFYATHVEVRQIDKVWFNRARLRVAELESLDRRLGAAWQDSTSSTPAYYVPTATGVRISKTPGVSGTALTWDSAVSITSTAGKSVVGNRKWSGKDGTTLKHFDPGDGVCTNSETAKNNVWVDYWYRPEPVTQNMSIARGRELALQNFALYRCLRSSRDAAMISRRKDAYDQWDDQRLKLIAQASDVALSAEHQYRTDISAAF